MNMLAELRNDILNFVMPLLGQEIPLRIAQVIEVCWSDDRRPQLHSKKKTELGYDFYYCLPVGITFKDFLSKKDYFRDAIGTHCTIDITHTGKMVTLKVVAQQLKEKYLYCWEYDRSGGELVVPIGYTHNQLVTVALEKIPHVLCGGTTGLGKSNFIHVVVNSLLHSPSKPDIILIDLKMSEYSYLESHAMLITEKETTSQVLANLVIEMRRRQKLLKQARCVNVAKYNEKHDKLKHIVLIVDELSELTDPAAQESLETLLRLCRSSAICIIAATQRPDRFTMQKFGTAKAQFFGRMAYACPDQVASRIILDNTMAAELPDIPGRGVWKMGNNTTIVQTPYIDPDIAERRLP